MRRFRFKDEHWGYVFIAPWVIGFLIFTLYPMIMSFVISLHNWDLFGDRTFIGFDNYVNVFRNDAFLISLSNTLIYTVCCTAVSVVVGVLVAYGVSNRGALNLAFRTIIYLPCLVIGLAFAMMMGTIFDASGLINQLLAQMGMPPQQWLSTPGQAVWVLVLMSLWGLGGPMVIYIAAFKNVDTAVLEAAEIDGASKLRILYRVSLPMITPVIIYQTITGVIYGLQVFDLPFGLATASGTADFGMGTNNALGTLAYYLFRVGFSGANGEMGKGSAVGWIIFAITLVFSAAVMLFVRKTKYYSLD